MVVWSSCSVVAVDWCLGENLLTIDPRNDDGARTLNP